MHYIPESTTEMLRGDGTPCARPQPNFHWKSAPLYVLTVIVALLLAADQGLWSELMTRSGGATLYGYRLALLAAILGGARILYRTLDGLLEGRVGADLALTLACLASIALGEHLTAGLVVLISLIGESLEGYTIDRARWAILQTFALWPEVVHVTREGREHDIPVEEVCVGDFVTVRPGERIPVDGHVIAGKSVVDQSSLTGEFVPVDRVSGDPVLAGTLNQMGALTIVSESIGENTVLARVARLVATATTKKADLERTADRLAKWFLPVVLVAALVTLVGWRVTTGAWRNGFLPALGVLVVACPCPLVLATPCAVMASLAWLARRGIVVKGSAALERLATVDTFAFDKTGTLTQGALALGQILPLSNHHPDSVLHLAAIAERNSEHLIARVIVQAAESRGMSLPTQVDFEPMAGAGVIAQVGTKDLSAITSMLKDAPEKPVDSEIDLKPRASATDGGLDLCETQHSIVVGNRRALDQEEIEFSYEVARLLKDSEAAGESPLVVALDGEIIGIIGVKETIRPESQQVLTELNELGIQRFALLTGDRPQPTDSIVRSLGRFEYVATEQLPADKARWVEESRKVGRQVAMVGDGVNDAPALAAANVGLAVGRAGGDLAAAAGDIILLGDPLTVLPGLVRLSRALVQNIWQSILIFAFGLNGLGVIACTVGWLDPVGGAIFHEFASLAVMVNAMRMLWFDAWSSTRATNVVARTLTLADWLLERASPSQWIFRLLEHWQLSLKLMGACALMLWFASGVTILTEDEQGFVTRFGRYQIPLSSGMHWRWPHPLERVTRENSKAIRSIGVGSRLTGQDFKRVRDPISEFQPTVARQASDGRLAGETTETIEWTTPHGSNNDAALIDEALMLTADEVPVELTAEVLYRVNDLRQFMSEGSQHPTEVLRAAAEGILREVAATASLDDLLTERRASLERKSLSALRSRIEPYRLGVEIVDLQWLDIHPPQAVVPAYRQVADALEGQAMLINEAEAYASRTLLATVGETGLNRLQSAARQQTPKMPHSGNRLDWELTDQLWQLLLLEETGQMRLSGSAGAVLLEGQAARIQHEQASIGVAKRFESLLKEHSSQPNLTRQSLYWTTVSEVLSKRPLMIVDPQVVNKQQLWLGPVPLPR